MTDPTPSDRLAFALCRSIATDLGGSTPPCLIERGGACSECREQSAAVAAELATILRERHGGSSQSAAAMIKALRAADLSNQPLSVGLADALEVLADGQFKSFETSVLRAVYFVPCDYLDSIIDHLRNNNHA